MLRFPLYTDADIHGPHVEALRRKGWDVMRAVDAYPEGTDDPIHFERAVREGRVPSRDDWRPGDRPMKTVELSRATGSLSEYVRQARRETLVLTRRGKAVAVMVPLSEDDWEDLVVSPTPSSWP